MTGYRGVKNQFQHVLDDKGGELYVFSIPQVGIFIPSTPIPAKYSMNLSTILMASLSRSKMVMAMLRLLSGMEVGIPRPLPRLLVRGQC